MQKSGTLKVLVHFSTGYNRDSPGKNRENFLPMIIHISGIPTKILNNPGLEVIFDIFR